MPYEGIKRRLTCVATDQPSSSILLIKNHTKCLLRQAERNLSCINSTTSTMTRLTTPACIMRCTPRSMRKNLVSEARHMSATSRTRSTPSQKQKQFIGMLMAAPPAARELTGGKNNGKIYSSCCSQSKWWLGRKERRSAARQRSLRNEKTSCCRWPQDQPKPEDRVCDPRNERSNPECRQSRRRPVPAQGIIPLTQIAALPLLVGRCYFHFPSPLQNHFSILQRVGKMNTGKKHFYPTRGNGVAGIREVPKGGSDPLSAHGYPTGVSRTRYGTSRC